MKWTKNRHNRKIKSYISIFLAALVLRLIWVFVTGSYVNPETWEYEEIAWNILNGRGFTCLHLGTIYYSLTQPIYPFFCAAVYFITDHSYLTLQIIQVFISSFICIIIYKIAKDIFDRRVAVFSALLIAVHPGLIIYTAKLHPLTIDTFFISLVVLAFLMLKADLSLRNQIIAGLASGLCLLTRSTIGLFLPFGILWLVHVHKGSHLKRKSIFAGFLILFVTFIVILPWQIRNYMIHKEFVFIQSTTEETLWLTNNAHASGSNYLPDGRPIIKAAPRAFLEKLYSLDEMGQRRYFREVAHNFIKANPSRSILLFLKRFYYSWWFSPQSGIEYPRSYLLMYKVFYAFMVMLAVLGIILGLRSNRGVSRQGVYLLLLCLSVISFTQSLFYVEGRHRWAIEPLFLVLSANGLVYLKGKLGCCLRHRE